MKTFGNSSYIVIPSMVEDMNLTLIEAVAFSVIHGFTQNGLWYSGSLNYVAKKCFSSKAHICRVMKKLVDMGYILKKEIFKDNQKFCKYRVNPEIVNGLPDYLKKVEEIDDNRIEEIPEEDCEKDETEKAKETPKPIPQVVGMNHSYTIQPNVSCETVEAETMEAPNTNPNYARELFKAWNAIGGMNSGEIRFLSTFGATRGYLNGLHSDDVFKAIENYGKVKTANGWYKHNLSWESFAKKIEQFLPNNFKIENYVDGEDLKKIEEQREAEQRAEEQRKAEQEAEEQRKAWEAKSTEEKAFYQLRAEWATNFFDKERVVELLEMWKSVETERSKNGYKTMMNNQKFGFEEKLPKDLWDGSFEEWKAEFLGARKTEAEAKPFLEQSPMSMIADTLKRLRGDTEEEAPKAEPKEEPKEEPKDEDDSMPTQRADESYQDYLRRLGDWTMTKSGV